MKNPPAPPPVDRPPVIVEFPLRGEWNAPNTPGFRVPSHGTHQLAQTWAYDFWRLDGKRRFHMRSFLTWLLLGVPLTDCHDYGAPIHAPFAGTVVTARDGWPERGRVNLFRDLAAVLKNAFFFDPRKHTWQQVLGNHVIIKGEFGYGFFAHARTGSVKVKPGDVVQTGDVLAEVGHSGNSTAPHLHFHLMDGPDLVTAKGIPCAFREYEVRRGGAWLPVSDGIPGRDEIIRSPG